MTYSSLVNWESPLGEDVEFSESGRVTVQPSVSTVRISPLTPGTTYTFNVVASTEDELGQETSVTGSTTGGVADRGEYLNYSLPQTCILFLFRESGFRSVKVWTCRQMLKLSSMLQLYMYVCVIVYLFEGWRYRPTFENDKGCNY